MLCVYKCIGNILEYNADYLMTGSRHFHLLFQSIREDINSDLNPPTIHNLER